MRRPNQTRVRTYRLAALLWAMVLLAAPVSAEELRIITSYQADVSIRCWSPLGAAAPISASVS